MTEHALLLNNEDLPTLGLPTIATVGILDSDDSILQPLYKNSNIACCAGSRL